MPEPSTSVPARGEFREPDAPSAAQLAARRYFPRGLIQPPGSYRFSVEALLLACLPRPLPDHRLLDLGTGCGVVALAALCREERMTAHGLDFQPELVSAARANAERLGFSRRFTAVLADLSAPGLFVPGPARSGEAPGGRAVPDHEVGLEADAALPLVAGSFDLVLANPPYRERRRGRLPRHPLRLAALFEEEHTLRAFCAAASAALAPAGSLAVVYPAVRQGELLSCLAQAGLRPVRLLPVLPRVNEPPGLLLLEAVSAATPGPEGRQRGAAPLPRLEAPLVLHEEVGGRTRFTEQALAFCPYLACNAGTGGKR